MADLSIALQIALLSQGEVAALKKRYGELYGEAPSSENRQWLLKRCAYRIQENEHGALSEAARLQLLEIGVRVAAGYPKARRAKNTKTALPPAGGKIVREYRGEIYEVLVTESGFEWNGESFKSLSAVAHAITGMSWSGYKFFGIERGGKR